MMKLLPYELVTGRSLIASMAVQMTAFLYQSFGQWPRLRHKNTIIRLYHCLFLNWWCHV